LRHSLLRSRPLRGGGPLYSDWSDSGKARAVRVSLLQGRRRRGPDHLRAAGRQGRGGILLEAETMRAHYDMSKMKWERNPYISKLKLKKPITIRLDTLTIDYFKQMAGAIGMPYQNLINLYLR